MRKYATRSKIGKCSIPLLKQFLGLIMGRSIKAVESEWGKQFPPDVSDHQIMCSTSSFLFFFAETWGKIFRVPRLVEANV